MALLYYSRPFVTDPATGNTYYSRPFVTDPATGNTVPSLNQDWFFGFWIGMTARIGN
ncbi:MAG: hypothetical protein JRD92_17740 [Deltaproteobacteria bacterium]|nr:hypothetical protein [Deltaproteobacteria bacterium]